MLPISTKKHLAGITIAIVLNVYISLGRSEIFATVSLPAHENDIFIYLDLHQYYVAFIIQDMYTFY